MVGVLGCWMILRFFDYQFFRASVKVCSSCFRFSTVSAFCMSAG